MRRLLNRKSIVLFVLMIAALSAIWVYWNRTKPTDMSSWAPADCLAFVELDSLADAAYGLEITNAWRSLAGPMGAPEHLVPNRWLVRLARWTGIGSSEAILLARSQIAVVFTGAEGLPEGTTLTIKPLITLVVETHTSQRRMRSAVERYIEDFARRRYKDPVFVRKQVGQVVLEEWTSVDGSHQIIFSFVETAVVIGNDEASLVRCIEARTGTRPSLRETKQFQNLSQELAATNATVFGFVSQPGVKSLLQASALSHGASSSDAVTGARIFADTVGGLTQGLGWVARFRDGAVEDRCALRLAEGVADRLRNSMMPDRGVDLSNLILVPADVHSFSLYQLHDPSSFWTDLNVALSSHTDLVGAIAARPMLKALLKPYGIEDPDIFARAIGPHIETIRIEENAAPVLLVEAYDRPALRKSIGERFAKNANTETLGDVELLTSTSDRFAAAFVDRFFLIGPVDAVRRCLSARTDKRAVSSTEAFRRAAQLVDVSRQISAMTFTNDQDAAISFVEVFSHETRSPFASEGNAITAASKTLPYAVSVSILNNSSIEWTSRSSFGIGGSFLVQMFPESPR